ncbi:MAG TPA: formyltransferase family protein, partial [Steroidobacteraceae bacterium]
PADANDPQLQQAIGELRPDLLFSFYYRSLLQQSLLGSARRGAFNMHGSLLPNYRGRAPVNWAILRGERETGATLHHMVARADAGDIVDQLAVPILADDNARDVFRKVTVAAEIVLARSLPGILAGTAPRTPQVLAPGQYFGRRRPQDGLIDWLYPAEQIHNLVRALAPPFPGAFTDMAGQRWWLHRTRVVQRSVAAEDRGRLFEIDGRCYAACADGSVLQLLEIATAEGPLDLRLLAKRLRTQPILLR